jgi:CspA family cold shock protein
MTRLTGKVKWFSTEKGYGFIERDGAEDVFVHRSEIRAGGASILEEGEMVEFDVESSPRGLKARGVERAGAERSDPAQSPGSREPGGAGMEAVGEPPEERPLLTLEEQLTSRLVPRFLRRI